MPIFIFLRPIGLDYWNPLRYVCTVRALHHCAPFLPPSVLLALSSYDSIENTGKAVPAPDTQWATVTERQRVHEKMSATRRLAPGGGFLLGRHSRGQTRSRNCNFGARA